MSNVGPITIGLHHQVSRLVWGKKRKKTLLWCNIILLSQAWHQLKPRIKLILVIVFNFDCLLVQLGQPITGRI